MNCLVPRILRGMTDGYFVNIGNAEDTSALLTEFDWEGLYIDNIDRPLNNIMESHHAPTIIHYLTIHEEIDAVTHLGQFFADANNKIGWKRRPIIIRFLSQYNTKELMDKYHYTLVDYEGNYNYYIHSIWDCLV